LVKIPMQVEPSPTGRKTPAVAYRWDPDTEILSAQVSPQAAGKGMSGSVELEGADGSWLILDVSSGHINSVEVAVWPDVQKRRSLQPPGSVEDGHVFVAARKSQPDVASLEVETAMLAEADEFERIFHFVLGKRRQTRTVRCARDLLVDLDGSNNLVGLWLLNVPPFPAHP
jgi:hypothetical protein